MTYDANAMLDAVYDSAVEISAISLGAILVHHVSVVAMIDPVLPGVLYGISCILVAISKVIRALNHNDPPENWLERKVKRIRTKKGQPDDESDSSAN